MKRQHGFPKKQGLYDPQFEHDNCGVGFICNVKGGKDNNIIKKGLEVLERMSHRGAVGADPKTGDGAGILMQMPHEFFLSECAKIGITLPEAGRYGLGLVFLPRDNAERKECMESFESIVKGEGLKVLGWRDVPVNNEIIGVTARETEPIIKQIIIDASDIKDQPAFERRLYVIRKRIETHVRGLKLKQSSFFYIPSLSSKTISYKGLLMPDQVREFFLDLKSPDIVSALALVHSRYSTNTFPTWDLAQPFRYLAHNGEINTLRGNINWMKARYELLKSDVFDSNIKKLLPIIVPGGSDSATLDNVFEFLVLSGRPLAHTVMMLVPAAWENNDEMPDELRAFYEYHACMMEPWDGPAALAFTDGSSIGASLDRNGLRPARYMITNDDMVIMASEMGVLDIDPKKIKYSGRLEPGKILLIDTNEGRIIGDNEVKENIYKEMPYKKWLQKNLLVLEDLPNEKAEKHKDEDYLSSLKAFGYTREDLKVIITPMAEDGKEPIGSMGNDAPLSVLSKNPQLLYTYFKQLFAQVTNPPIDPIREHIVMSLESYIGPEKNILDSTEEHCKRLKVKDPVLLEGEFNKLEKIRKNGFKSKKLSLLFPANDKDGFKTAIDRICDESETAISDGYTFIILSDRGVTGDMIALPALPAVGAVHHHLVKKSLRKKIGIILESAEPREVHHFALLFGYGADCIYPYKAYEVVKNLVSEKYVSVPEEKAIYNYRYAVNHGILKILSKMGISTLQSYRGAQIFEALGIHDEIIDKCFCGTPSRIGGITFDIIDKETRLRHSEAFNRYGAPHLNFGGQYQWRKNSEFHLWNPDSISALQDAARNEDYERYKQFADLINNQSNQPATLRSLIKLKDDLKPISIDKVEPVESIVKRFVTGAMSFGSISKGAHETLAIAMNRLKGMSNTGEGGEDPARFAPMPNGDSRRSAIKQVASGRFGVTANYLANSDEIQIKIAQGAKPGEGGQLPGHKVSAIIARTRYTTQGVTLISPPPHHDIYSIEDLAQLIFDLKNANPRARISVKLVSEVGVGTVAAGVAKGHADMILISGGDGGTGASPLSSLKHAGLPWELGLSETHQTLVLNDLRSRVRLQADGQMRTGRDVAMAAILGAEEYGFCTAGLIVMGCLMLRHCHLNNCSLGVATQDEVLQDRFSGRPEHVVNYMRFVAEELREFMAQAGITDMNDLIGRTDLVEVNKKIIPWKAEKIDYSKILYKPDVPKETGVYKTMDQNHNISDVLDRELIKLAEPALKKGKEVKINLNISNVNRTTGTMLSNEMCMTYGEDGLPDHTISCKFKGIAGQSFGAFLAKGITFELEGLANDYVGKGISGGKIIIYPYKNVPYVPAENILIGNTTFYGAIDGEAYIRGKAGERFCIRNSGLHAVVEGVGDHGCEYMTGGVVVILGKTGRNFAAGMSGGVAYVYDDDGAFKSRCNMDMVEIESLEKDDKETIHALLHNHIKYTQSALAERMLADSAYINKFIKVMPIEYKRILNQRKLEQKMGIEESE
ncbi:MAG: glutamate synthase large subunit [Elusimicrobiota bacterium]